MRQKVMIFGSFVVDQMARASHLPSPGETVKGNLYRRGAGGKGFNQGIAAQKSGGDVAMVTKLGRDTMANVALDLMDAVGLSKEHLFFSDDAPTGTALIFVDEKTSQNQIIIVPGACATITARDVATLHDAVKESNYLLLQLEVNQDANEAVAKIAKENGVRVILNTAPYQAVSDEFLRGCYLVTPNEVEAQEMTGIAVNDLESADKAAEVFFRKGVENVLITLGSRGVYVNSGGYSEIVPAYRVNALDTTGAGDAFNGALLTALSEGLTLPEAARFANAAAALSVQKLGTADSMATRAEIDAFLQAQ